MITLYVKTSCPFCMMVQAKVDELGIEVNELNIADGTNGEDLIKIGGKRQVPYMIDDEAGVSMYESSDIIEYLNSKYERTEESNES